MNQKKQVSAEVIRRNMLWNVIGSTGFIGAQWMMTILIVHLAGYEEAGYLSLGLSLTNIFTNIAYFCIRNFQVSDTRGRYGADTYVSHRVLAAFAAMGVHSLFVCVNGYSLYVTVFLLLFMVYRLSEPVADVFHGIDQKAWRLDIAGKSFLLRGMVSLAVFIVVETLGKNLVVTVFVMCVFVYGILFGYDIPNARKLEKFTCKWNKRELTGLTAECLPLFLYAICLNAVVPVPRYFLEKTAGSEALGFYSSVAIPASVIQLLSSYVFTTFTRLFSDYAEEKKKREFLVLFWKLAGAVGGITLLAAVGAALLGEWALVLLFTESIRAYARLLVPTVLCCGMIAFVWYLGTVLTVLRDRKTLLTGAVLGALTVTAVSYPCIICLGVDGVNVALAISNVVTLGVFAWGLWMRIKDMD